jgi:hypothetical protein
VWGRYVVSHFNSIIDISHFTDGVRIQRVRIRANMFFGADWWGSASHPAGADGGRGVPWIFSGGGRNPAIPIHGKNFVVSDSDLWVSGTVFKSDGQYTSHLCPSNRTGDSSVWESFIDADCVFSSARWGLIANNTIMNGGACHWFDQVQQVVFEVSHDCASLVSALSAPL